MTKVEVIQVLALLQTAFPNTRIDADATVNLWYSMYRDVDFAVAKRATELVIKNNDFFPNHKEFGKALYACSVCNDIENEPKKISKYSQESEDRIIENIIQDMIDLENEMYPN